MNTTTLVQNIKSRYDHRLNKRLLEEKYMSKLLTVSQGGYWLANRELIAFLSNESLGSEVHVADEYNNILLVDRVKLLTDVLRVYQSVMLQWSEELNTLKAQR